MLPGKAIIHLVKMPPGRFPGPADVTRGNAYDIQIKCPFKNNLSPRYDRLTSHISVFIDMRAKDTSSYHEIDARDIFDVQR